MTNEAKSAEKRPPKPAANGGAANGSALYYAAFFENSQHAYVLWLESMFALSQEITRFVLARMQEEATASFALAACRNAQQAFELQRRFATKAVEQYSEEVGKVSQMMTRLASVDQSSPAQERMGLAR